MSICLIMYAFNKLFAAPTYCDRNMETKKNRCKDWGYGCYSSVVSTLAHRAGPKLQLIPKAGAGRGRQTDRVGVAFALCLCQVSVESHPSTP